MIKCKFTFPGADELSLQSKVSEKKSMPGTVGKRTGESKMNEMRRKRMNDLHICVIS